MLQWEGDGDWLCAQNMDHREDKDMRRCTNGNQTQLVSEEKLRIFMRKKTILVKNIQVETQLSNDIQACQLIPTNPHPMSGVF